ncbi:hypothetical protein pb186bvf_015378 [Paramecium bursaria]
MINKKSFTLPLTNYSSLDPKQRLQTYKVFLKQSIVNKRSYQSLNKEKQQPSFLIKNQIPAKITFKKSEDSFKIHISDLWTNKLKDQLSYDTGLIDVKRFLEQNRKVRNQEQLRRVRSQYKELYDMSKQQTQVSTMDKTMETVDKRDIRVTSFISTKTPQLVNRNRVQSQKDLQDVRQRFQKLIQDLH